ncbi:peptidase inhibitor family I36 protein [Micromonospora sp. CPCC 205561]|uniref:peptidase inhibitor family I36 protein n=1 Tax=Micromonospora sp. CPCC 205561 TaxID=3122407 RepID=UPI002FF36BEE
MKKPLSRAAVLLAIAATALVVGQTSAQASESQCTAGQVCVWGENDYTGCFRGMTANGFDYSTITWSTCSAKIDNGANSVKNEGRSCAVRLYTDANHSGSSILFNREADGANFRDPYLANGGGLGSANGLNWQDRISSHKFCP